MKLPQRTQAACWLSKIVLLCACVCMPQSVFKEMPEINDL